MSRSLRTDAARGSTAQFILFCVSGTIGFLVDTGVLYAMLGLGMGPYAGRLVSYVAAATTTWVFNRNVTFRHAPGSGRAGTQWGFYVAASTLGFVVNYGVYALSLMYVPLAARHPVLGVAAGAIAGLAVNFTVSKFVIFRGAPAATLSKGG